MLKVVQIIYSGMGGHGSVAFSLIDADKHGEWRPMMGFVGVEPLLPAYGITCQARDISYKYFAALPGKTWRTWPHIFRWLRESRPQAIVLHGMTALLPSFIFARRRGVPTIAVEHQANALKSRTEWVFSCLAMVLADRVVVLTPVYDLELKQRLGLFYRANKVRIIPNGIDTSRFAPSSHARTPGQSVQLGMAGRFTSTKRQDVLVDMLAELRRREPGIDWRLSLAGGGTVWDSVNRKVRAEGLDACVTMPGQLDEDQLIDWYRSIDVYLHASEGETLSTSLLQAMASALPIVASDVPGIRDLVSGKTICGVLVEGQRPEGFASAVTKLVKEPAVAAALGEAGLQLIEKIYSSDQMFAKYRALLTKAD